ncbi:hypothetical protein ACLMAJ_08415 [Nocardia sp. KC 131]|uniref:hypothetical protein n=1 Tax=Nocardia arseniciresistens TaxID=3392119 RepID=UPI00398EFA89
MRAKSNQFFVSMLAVVSGSLVIVSGPVAVAQPSSEPTQECQSGATKNEGANYCVCGEDGKWSCHLRVQER